jgi:hypothetical protein
MVTPAAERRLLLAGAASAAFFIAAQAYQLVVNRLVLGPASDLEAEVAQLVSGPAQLRQILILASLFALPASFGAVAWARRREAPFAAAFGFVFGLVFVIAEVLYRGVELALVTRRWGVSYLAAPEAERGALAAKIEAWNELVGGWYFSLLAAHLLASVCFLVAARRARDGSDRALAVAFGLNTVRLVVRIAGFAGLSAAADLSRAVYFPAIVAVFATIAFWLFREARQRPA